MKKFVFKLERILRIKEHKEHIAKEQYAKVLQQKQLLEKEVDDLYSGIERAIDSDILYESNIVDYNSLSIRDNYIKGLKIKIEQNKTEIERLLPTLEELREALFLATKERKIFTKLREKEHIKYKEEIQLDEIKSIDDSANKAYILSRFGGEDSE